MQTNSRPSCRNLSGYVDQLVPVEELSLRLLAQTLEQTAVNHQFRDDEDGLLARTHRVQPHDLWVVQLLHDLRLLEELERLHRTDLQRLYGHWCPLVPHTCNRKQGIENKSSRFSALLLFLLLL